MRHPLPGLTAVALLGLALMLPAFGQTREQAQGTGMITGRITIGENPISGVAVGLLSAQPNSPGTSGTLGKVTTDADGRYRLTQVHAGSFRVTPLAPGYVAPSDSLNPFEQGKAVNLREGETAEGLDFSLTRGGVITGKITDANGKPMIEQRLSLWKFDASGRKNQWYSQDPAAITMMLTDDRGIYRIYGMPEGRYIIAAGVANGPNEMTGRVSGISYKRTYYPDTTEENQAKPIEVTPGSEANDIDIRLAGETVKGYNVLARVVDAETGAPLPGVNLGWMPYSGDRMSGGIYRSAADGQGLAHFDGLQPGRYAAMLFNAGQNSSDYFSDPTTFEVVDSDVVNVEVRAQRGATITGKAIVEGVTDPAIQARLSELQIGANSRPSTPNAGIPSFGSNFKINPDGSFRVGGLRPGKVQLSYFYSSGRGPAGYSILRVEHDGVPQQAGIEVTAGQQVANVRIVFAYGQGIVRGQVQIVGGTLPQGARMNISARRVDNPTGPPSGTTSQVDTRGRFTIG